MPAPYQVVVTDFLDETAIESQILDGVAELVLARARDEDELIGRVKHADALYLFHEIPMISDALLAHAPRCRAVVRAGVGYNNVDIAAAGRRGVAVCNVPDYGTEEVADHAIMMLLAVARHLVPANQAIRGGTWDYRSAIDTPRMRGKTLGLVGFGRIGQATALRARAFGLDVLFYDPYVPPGIEKAFGVRRADSLDDLLEQSPFVSLHCYLDEMTHHLIDAKALARMPRGGILVNTARGPIVDQDALREALDSGHLLGAALDVVEREPLDDDRLRDHPRIIFTPHSAFYSIEGFVELRRKAAEELRRLFVGQPPRCLVNREHVVNPRFALG